MENRQVKFLDAISNNEAYDYIAKHYYEYQKDELKNIILEMLYEFEGRDKTTPAMLDVKAELEDRWSY